MARFGTFDYGTGVLYGDSGNENLLWIIQVDWDGDGVFGSNNEAQFAQRFVSRRGRQHFILPDGKGFEPQEIGIANITLLNEDGRFDPFNTSGPLYPNVEPGKFVRVQVKDALTDITYDIFAGRLTNITPFSFKNNDMVIFEVKDGWEWLEEADANIAVQTNILTGDAIGTVLDDVSWPSVWGRDISGSSDAIPFWWEFGVNAAQAIQDLNDSEVGQVTVAANGSLKFRGRSATSTSVLTIDETQMLKDIPTPNPWEVVRNIARVVIHPLVSRTAVVLWNMIDIPLVPDGEENAVPIFATLTFDNRSTPTTNLITPVKITDFAANSLADGSGSDLTDDFDITITETFGESAKLTITNTSGVQGFVTSLQLRGDALDNTDSSFAEVDSRTDPSDQPRRFILDSKNQQVIGEGNAEASFLADFLLSVREFPGPQVEQRPAVQFGFDLQERVTLDIPTKGINLIDYRVGFIEHQWLQGNGQAVLTRFQVEPFKEIAAAWKFDTAKFDDAATMQFGF